ncbi:hypothetical protein F5Y18DRAFT_203580 [Xylariaceae sp. FL1019]|nr:hypothetical protein F5Y18DRAFT_203580 [Xylariaceae sp. FL1019]
MASPNLQLRPWRGEATDGETGWIMWHSTSNDDALVEHALRNFHSFCPEGAGFMIIITIHKSPVNIRTEVAHGNSSSFFRRMVAKLARVYPQGVRVAIVIRLHPNESRPCANCNKVGHSLADCVFPLSPRGGDITGCPFCNTKSHGFDDCCASQFIHPVILRNLFLLAPRLNKPLIRSEWPLHSLMAEKLIELGSEELPAIPWTREQAIELQNERPEDYQRLDEYDYSQPPHIPVWRQFLNTESFIAYTRDMDGSYTASLERNYDSTIDYIHCREAMGDAARPR